MTRKVAIIGLDCAEPTLVFERWAADLPNLRRLAEAGMWGRLESCLPPITVPAWTCMASSKDPGTLGIYGFRNRRDWSYENLGLATNLDVQHPRLWDFVARAGLPSILVGVPQTFPITRPPLGCMITCFLTPSLDSPWTHPPELAGEITALVGAYQLDVDDFRTNAKEQLLGRIHALAKQRFEVGRHLLSTRPWSLFWMVEMGVDRIHHAFWQYMDPRHHRYQAGHPLEDAIHDYYVMIDREIGELCKLFDADTAVWVVSDHGAQCMDGGFCFNDWLIREGLLTLKTPASEPRRFSVADVDWTRTKVWGEGGYYGRCFLNVAGREPQGTVPAEQYEALRSELIERLEVLPDHTGRPMGARAYRPQEIYAATNGHPPDLIVLFGDLRWRSVGSVGHADVYTFENDTGPDDANHARHGMHVLSPVGVSNDSRPGIAAGRRDASLYDVLPTCLDWLGLPRPKGMRGRSLLGGVKGEK